jgi:hypothetical protein
MAAELTGSTAARQWQFTAGALNVVLLVLPRDHSRVLAVAVAGLLVTAAAAAAASNVPMTQMAARRGSFIRAPGWAARWARCGS